MIDSLSTSEPEEHLLIGGWKFQRSILEWLWKLVSMGFPDFLLGLIKDVISLCQEIKQTSHSSRLDSTPDTQVTPTIEMAVTRNDAYTLSLVLLLRILHKFLMLDNQFAKWQMHGPLAGDALAPGDFLSNHIPPGTILSLIKVDTFIPLLMKTMIAVLQRVIPSNFTSVSTSLALVEHSILVIFGLLQSVDQPVEILNSYPDFYRWIRSSLLRVPAKEIRRASARRILECSALMLLRCRDATDFSSAEKASRVELFHHLFFSVLKATHPGFDGSLGGQQPIVLRQGTDSHSELSDSQEACVARDAYSLLGPEHYRNGEELYNLIAGLLTLRSRPEILNAIKIGSLEEVCGSPETAPANWIREENLCFFFVERLFTHRSLETFHSSISDGTLLGLLRALIVISHASPQCQILLGRIRLPSFLPPSHHQTSSVTLIGLIRFLYFHCLFPQSSPTTNQNRVAAVVGICQTPNSRQLVYALLLGLCGSNKENLTQLLEVLTATSASSRGGLSNVPGKKVRRRLWEYDPSALLKPSGASLGLVNQGATCYMNSFLQQLYHVKCFSNHLLEIDCDPTESDNATVLFELQVLFGYLRFSQKNYCDTLSFCKSFKDYDGEPVRLGEQKDVNEFAAMLFEKLETNEDCKSLLQNCFGGKLVWQIISTESTYRSEREEPFFMLTAEVKDKSSLEDSLELYVTGEMLSGDNKIEDSTGKKVDALRRCTIRTLPEVLIIHLKRFEFDLETMNRQKLNDLISFPEELDMFPYTEVGIQQSEERRKARAETSDPSNGEDEEQEQVEGVVAEEDLTTSTMDEENETNESKGNDDPPSLKPPSLEPIPDPVGRAQYEYRLKGIVAHTGAIDSGHYYSFIRNENGNAWMEYNDSSVLCFDSGSIPGECFGGPLKKPSTGSHPGGAPAPVSPQAMKQYNAYILVYERKGEESNGKFPFSPRKNPKPQEVSPKAGDSSVESSHADSPTENGSSDMPVVEVETEEILRPRDRSASMLVDCEDDLPKNGRNLASRAGGISGSISDGVMQAVWSENTAFLLDRTRFNIEYILFYWKLLDLPLIGSLQEEITAREEAGNSMSMSPGDQNSSSHLSNQILSKLSLSCFEFCVEILARARAHQCLPHFVEKLEDIVMRDISGSSAESILSALARDPESPLLPLPGQSPLPPGTPENIQSQPSHSSSLSLGGRLQEDRDIVSKVDQMLITMFVDCPHTFTTSTFSRLLMWCIKILRRRHSSFYLSTFPPKAPLPSEHADLPREEGSPEPDATCDPVQAQRMREERMEACHQYQSCVTRFVGKLLILTDFYQPEDLMERRGNESLSDLLMRFACLGDEEKNVLINFGAIYRYCSSFFPLTPHTLPLARVVCSSIVLYPAHRQYPARDCLRNSIGFSLSAFLSPLMSCLQISSRFWSEPRDLLTPHRPPRPSTCCPCPPQTPRPSPIGLLLPLSL
jgi:ubiquitin C-terminal hydrolase